MSEAHTMCMHMWKTYCVKDIIGFLNITLLSKPVDPAYELIFCFLVHATGVRCATSHKQLIRNVTPHLHLLQELVENTLDLLTESFNWNYFLGDSKTAVTFSLRKSN